MDINNKTVILCILDGWGHSDIKQHNAIAAADLKFMNYLMSHYPNSKLEASGAAVGLAPGQMGNSEVGHMTIGAGRPVIQDLERINLAIRDGSFRDNQVLLDAISKLKQNKKACHIIGLVSDGGIHSHINHIIEYVKLFKDYDIKYYLHAITDGRDTPPSSARHYFDLLEKNQIDIATLSGRFYAMDRDKRFERTAKYYEAIVNGNGIKFDNLDEVLVNNNDEFIEPHVSKSFNGIHDGDLVFMINFRADRVRQILSSLFDNNFSAFPIKKLRIDGLGVASYFDELSDRVKPLFPKQNIANTLGEIISNHGYKQLRIAETEKYAHVTYFFNGGREEPYQNEDRVLIPSPKVTTYDLCPSMSAYEITDALIEAIDSKRYQFICVNFANADMVGHTANMEATIKACEVIDECLERIAKAIIRNNADMLITSDHGNAEQLFDTDTMQRHTAHTKNKVPLIYFGNKNIELADGELKDIAKITLNLLDIEL